MNAIKFKTTVDEATAQLLPALRPMLGQHVEVIALQTDAEADSDFPKLTLEQLLARRVNAPSGAEPLTEEDIRRAIVQGALTGNA